MTPLYLWLAIVPVLLALDLLWIGVLMKDFYQTHLGHLMSGSVVWPAAIAFYLMYAAGLVYFAVLPGVAAGSLARTFLYAALLGAFAYATYDLTNQATLRDWPVIVTILDIAWGACLSGALGAFAFWLAGRF